MKRLARLCAIVTLMLAACVSGLAAQYEPRANEKASLSEGSVLYSQIGVESDDELESGTTVDVVEIDGEWAKIRFMEADYFVPVSVLTATDEQLEENVSISSTGRTFYLSRDCGFVCDQSDMVINFDRGEPLTMLGAETGTAKVLHAGVIGYVPLDALALTRDLTYELGLPGDSIKPMQQELERLGYFDGIPNGVLDIDTVDAVLRFRNNCGMSDEFNVEGEFREALYSDNAQDDPIRILSLGLSDAGGAVERLQKRLSAKGYLVNDATGFYDTLTSQAVALFQSMQRFEETGLANTQTMTALFSSDARTLPRNLMPVSPETIVFMPGNVQNVDWWESGIQDIFAIGTVATITDVETGLSWREMRRGGTNHADVQPLTAQDTAIFLSAAGGKWSWDRRAVWVTIDYVRYAASMNCMPHGGGQIKDNNFDGHHCIHFLNSRTHAGNRLDERHQACVSKAAGLSDLTNEEIALLANVKPAD